MLIDLGEMGEPLLSTGPVIMTVLSWLLSVPFFIGGPKLAYSRTNPPGMMPSYEELMTEVDEQGEHQRDCPAVHFFPTSFRRASWACVVARSMS